MSKIPSSMKSNAMEDIGTSRTGKRAMDTPNMAAIIRRLSNVDRLLYANFLEPTIGDIVNEQ